MTDAAFAIIYCALLASRFTGTCTSPRSAVEVIVGCMHHKPTHASKAAPYQNVVSDHVLRQCRREAAFEQIHLLSVPGNGQKKNIKGAVPHARKLKISNHACSSVIWNPLLRLQSTSLQHSSTAMYDTVAFSSTTRCDSIRAMHSGLSNKLRLSQSDNLFNRIESPNTICDPLSRKADAAAVERFYWCIKDETPRSVSELTSIWEDMEAANCHQKFRDWAPLIKDYSIRVFAKVIIDNSCAQVGDLTIPNAKEFICLLGKVCDVLKTRYQRHEEDVRAKLMLPLLCHSMILKGELLSVRNMLLKEKPRNLPDRTRTITQLFLASVRLYTLPEAFEFLAPLWPVCVRHVDDAVGRFTTKEMNAQSTGLREALFGVFGGIKDPAAWINDSFTKADVRLIAGHFFSAMFREQNDFDKALDLFNDLQARRLPLSFHAHMVLIKMFLPDQCDVANRIHQSLLTHFPEKTGVLETRDKDELHTGFRLFSLQGDVSRAEEYFNMLKGRGLVDRGVQRRLMHAYAVNGNTQQSSKLFTQFFIGTKLDHRDFREVIYSHVRAGDMKGINYWIDEMVKRNIKPDLGVYNMILLAFSTSLDLVSAIAVLQRMRDNNVKPDHVSYSTVMSIMAENKDPVAAEQLYQRALEEGVVPDDIMIFTLMNAHVEAGSWSGVIRAFDYLQKFERSKHLTAQLYNVLLKAYVLIGAPFDSVQTIFQRYRTLGLEPTEHSYALLIQSACEAGRMDIAGDLFIRLEELTATKGDTSYINVYVMTIIMASFLRIGEKERAQKVYEDMQTRAIQPTSITFNVIINSYANERSQESLRVAEEFMQGLLNAEESKGAWIGSARGGRTRALDAVYGPLISIYGQELNVSAVEKYFDEMLAAGGQPTLITLTMLMDAYRRVRNIDGVQHIWTDVVTMARQLSQEDTFHLLSSTAGSMREDMNRRPRQENLLCVPLSVYINALSEAGKHIEIAKTWRQVKDWGFSFDAHNWNHLAVALVRAGEVERAFEIVERVILPYQRQTYKFVRERQDPTTPLTFLGRPAVEKGEELPRRSPRTPSRRDESVRSATRHRTELTPLGEDPAQQLHELQQLSFSWHAWRAHRATLDVLNGALRRLRAGVLVRPEKQPLPPGDDLRRMSEQGAVEYRARVQVQIGEMMGRIYRNYPNTIQLLEQREGTVQRVQRNETMSYS